MPDPPKPVGSCAACVQSTAASALARAIARQSRPPAKLFNEVLCRSMADLTMLMTETPQGRYPYAGIPWYSRHSVAMGLITACRCFGSTLCCARRATPPCGLPGEKRRPAADAQPGKILHEMRRVRWALREVPFGPLLRQRRCNTLFCHACRTLFRKNGDKATITKFGLPLRRRSNWIEISGDADGDGFVEYYRALRARARESGLEGFARPVFHADGRLAEGPIALAEVQGLRVLRQASGRAMRQASWQDRARPPPRRKPIVWLNDLMPAFGARNWRRMHLRLMATSNGVKCAVQMPVRCCFTALPSRSGRPWSLTACCVRSSFLAGDSHHRQYRGALQSDVIPQWFDLAARQCADRSRPRRYGQKRRRAPVQGPVRGGYLHGHREIAGTVLRLSTKPGRGPNIILSPARRRHGPAQPFTMLEASLGLEFRPCRERDPSAKSETAGFLGLGRVARSTAGKVEHRPQK